MDNIKVKVASDLVDKNFLGTYLTENGSTAVVVTRSAMIVNRKKQVIWVGFVYRNPGNMLPQFEVWTKDGKSFATPAWDLKEAVREPAY